MLSIVKATNDEVEEIVNSITRPSEVHIFGIDISPAARIPSLGSFKNLMRVEINDTNITDISCLKGLPLLEEISASGNKIECIQDIATLPAIKSVVLYGNKIQNIEPLKKVIEYLNHLNIEANMIPKEDILEFYFFTQEELKQTTELRRIQHALAKVLQSMAQEELNAAKKKNANKDRLIALEEELFLCSSRVFQYVPIYN
jgi:hypothetical protein